MYCKSAAIHFTKQTAISPQSGLSNEMLCILTAQGDAKLLEVKIEGWKKFLSIKGVDTNFFRPLLTSLNFVAP